MSSAVVGQAGDFYLDLYSNASLEFFPENTLSTFKNHLPNSIPLEGTYYVGLTEIVLPNNLDIISEGRIYLISKAASKLQRSRNTVETQSPPYQKHSQVIKQKPSYSLTGSNTSKPEKAKKTSRKWPTRWRWSEGYARYAFVFHVPSDKHFRTGHEFVKYLDTVFRGESDEQFIKGFNYQDDFTRILKRRMKKQKKKKRAEGEVVEQESKDDDDEKYFPFRLFSSDENGLTFMLKDPQMEVFFESSLARILGFGLVDNQWLHFAEPGLYHYPFLIPDLEASKSRLLSVYTNIIDPIIVGGKLLPSLRTISIPVKQHPSLNEQISLNFNPIHYVRVSVSSLNTIEIKLRGGNGLPLAFQYGLIYLRLHFKRISPAATTVGTGL